jgi:hypothetical protein
MNFLGWKIGNLDKEKVNSNFFIDGKEIKDFSFDNYTDFIIEACRAYDKMNVIWNRDLDAKAFITTDLCTIGLSLALIKGKITDKEAYFIWKVYSYFREEEFRKCYGGSIPNTLRDVAQQNPEHKYKYKNAEDISALSVLLSYDLIHKTDLMQTAKKLYLQFAGNLLKISGRISEESEKAFIEFAATLDAIKPASR